MTETTPGYWRLWVRWTGMLASGFLLTIGSSRIYDTWGQSQSILVQSLLDASEILIASGLFILWIVLLRPWFASAQDWVMRAVSVFCGMGLAFVMVWFSLHVLPFVVLTGWRYLLFYGGMGMLMVGCFWFALRKSDTPYKRLWALLNIGAMLCTSGLVIVLWKQLLALFPGDEDAPFTLLQYIQFQTVIGLFVICYAALSATGLVWIARRLHKA